MPIREMVMDLMTIYVTLKVCISVFIGIWRFNKKTILAKLFDGNKKSWIQVGVSILVIPRKCIKEEF